MTPLILQKRKKKKSSDIKVTENWKKLDNIFYW